MNRQELQVLADLRVEDARVLLEGGRFSAAYYLLGYAVECALKACIAKKVKEHDFPDKQLALDSYSHDLEQLLRISGVAPAFDSKARSDRSLQRNWITVKDWTEAARYDHNVTEVEGEELLNAITNPRNGVLTWLKTVW